MRPTSEQEIRSVAKIHGPAGRREEVVLEVELVVAVVVILDHSSIAFSPVKISPAPHARPTLVLADLLPDLG